MDDYSWSKNIYDRDGDLVEECIVIHRGNSSWSFETIEQLEEFLEKVKRSLKEIKEWS
jgi:hypothetical protein